MQKTPLSPVAGISRLQLSGAAPGRPPRQSGLRRASRLGGLEDHAIFDLAKLNRLGPLSINELAKLMVMDRTTLGRAVRPLERDKLLAIGGDDDGRKRSLRLTPAGQARLKAATAKWREAQKEFELAYGVADSASLRTALQRVVTAT